QSPIMLPAGLNASSTTGWLKRQADGKISWIATLVPKFDVSGLPSNQYILSIVMIYERADALDLLDDRKERVVAGVWQSAGYTGGEILLASDKLDALKVRPNDWLMVSGSYMVNGSLISRFQWYRIS